MKKTKFLSVVALMLFIYVQNTNCNEHRAVSMRMNEQAETTNRCIKLQTDANFFRAYGTGAARHQNTAMIKAQMKANSVLSNAIQTWIKAFLLKYLYVIGQNPETYMQVFEERGKDSMEEKIFNNVAIACDGVEGMDNDGLYNAYLILEVKRKNVFEALNKVLSMDKNWKDIYNRQKMDALFKAETSELKKRK